MKRFASHLNADVPVRNFKKLEEEAFLISLPSKSSLGLPGFVHCEVPNDRKCSVRNSGEPYTPNNEFGKQKKKFGALHAPAIKGLKEHVIFFKKF